MDDETRTLYAEIILGEDAARFFQTDIGKYVLGEANREIEEIKQEFYDIDPEDSKKIADLKFKWHVTIYGVRKLDELIRARVDALNTLNIPNEE